MAHNRRGPTKGSVSNMTLLDSISPNAILKNLRVRYEDEQIHTSIGPVLVAINPFKMIPSQYTPARIREYRGAPRSSLEPHVYGIADEAYRQLIGFSESQCIIITGESGSGKTETSKIVMQYISAVSGKSREIEVVKAKLLAANPVLEAFGNAKTVNNNNSSRFGKYMQVVFDFKGDPTCAKVTNYLLEKARVCAPGPNERNFHSFYQIVKHVPPQWRDQLLLQPCDYYCYLSVSGCYDVVGIDDAKEYQEMIEGMRTLQFSEEDIEAVHRVVAATLWLGNLTFTEGHDERSSVVDRDVLDIVASVLGVDSGALEKALCCRGITTGFGARAEFILKPLRQADAEFSRDTLAKALYSKLFDTIVRKINVALHDENVGSNTTEIGILDIYGFEIMEYNCFEQLCINFTNEKLQQIFIELTIKSEQEEYQKEGIPWEPIPYFNNEPTCTLIEGKPGVFSVLDDCCHTKKTDQNFVQDLGNFFSSHKAMRVGGGAFTIQHYAGEVSYHAEGFCAKNKDTLFDDLVELVQTSSYHFVGMSGWADIEVHKGQKKRPITCGKQFTIQCEALMKALSACTPHYIRCIKPNHEKTPLKFDNEYVKHQIKYLGLEENIRVRRAGYADRVEFSRFVKRYRLLCREVLFGEVRGTNRELCLAILSSMNWREGVEFAVGHTKVFIRSAASVFLLEDCLERRTNEAARVIQRAFRLYKGKRFLLRMRHQAWSLMQGQKNRRRCSVDYTSMSLKADQLDLAFNPLVAGMIRSTSGGDEKVLFTCRVQQVKLRPKRGLMDKVRSTFSRVKDQTVNFRLLLLTPAALYSFVFEENEATRQTNCKLYYRVELSQIRSVVLSPFADNIMCLNFGGEQKSAIYLCRSKTLFCAFLSHAYQEANRTSLSLLFKQEEQISWLGGKKKNKPQQIALRWQMGAATVAPQTLCVSDADEQIALDTRARVYTVFAAPGVDKNAAPEPFKPPEIDPTRETREQYRAIGDFPGNGIDECSFETGDVLLMNQPADGGWFQGTNKRTGSKGFVPLTYVEKIVEPVRKKAPPRTVQAPAQSVQAPARSVQAPARSVQAPARSVQAPARSVQAPPRQFGAARSVQAPPRAAVQAPPRAAVQAPPRAAVQAPPRAAVQAPARTNVQAAARQFGARPNPMAQRANPVAAQRTNPVATQRTNPVAAQRANPMATQVQAQRTNPLAAAAAQRANPMAGGATQGSVQMPARPAQTAPVAPPKPKLPPSAWSKHYDEASGSYYMFNSQTGESKWC